MPEKAGKRNHRKGIVDIAVNLLLLSAFFFVVGTPIRLLLRSIFNYRTEYTVLSEIINVAIFSILFAIGLVGYETYRTVKKKGKK